MDVRYQNLKQLLEEVGKAAAEKGFAVQVKFFPLADLSSLNLRQKVEIFGPDTEDDLK